MSSPNVIPFTFNTHEVRVVDRDGTPWWVLTDVCGVLEIAQPTSAARQLDEDEKNTVLITHSIPSRGNPNVTIINESGLWSLVLTSRKPQAKAFKKWLTSVVIPALRRDGAYIVGEEKIETAEDLNELEAIQDKIAALMERKAAVLEARIARQASEIDQRVTSLCLPSNR